LVIFPLEHLAAQHYVRLHPAIPIHHASCS
jgi:hypothetical protein